MRLKAAFGFGIIPTEPLHSKSRSLPLSVPCGIVFVPSTAPRQPRSHQNAVLPFKDAHLPLSVRFFIYFIICSLFYDRVLLRFDLLYFENLYNM